MAKKQTPKIASPGATAKAAPKGKKAAPVVPAATLEAIAPGVDPSALVAKLCPVDIPGSIKILAKYKRDRSIFTKANDEVASVRGTMNATKKEMIDKGWERKAVSMAMDLADMDPEMMQRVLAQTFVLCRSKVLDLPLGVVNGTSGDLFDPERVYRFGKVDKDAAAAETDDKGAEGAAKSTAQFETERAADIFENGRSSGLKGEHMKIPAGIKDDAKAVEVYTAGWTRGQKELLDRNPNKVTGNVTPIRKGGAASKADPAPAGGAEVEFG